MHQNLFNQNYAEMWMDRRISPLKPKYLSTQSDCLTLHMDNGRKAIFYYAYLLSVELTLKTDHSVLTLYFTSKKVILKGCRLDILFTQYSQVKPKVIEVSNSRYAQRKMNQSAVVTEAIIEERN